MTLNLFMRYHSLIYRFSSLPTRWLWCKTSTQYLSNEYFQRIAFWNRSSRMVDSDRRYSSLIKQTVYPFNVISLLTRGGEYQFWRCFFLNIFLRYSKCIFIIVLFLTSAIFFLSVGIHCTYRTNSDISFLVYHGRIVAFKIALPNTALGCIAPKHEDKAWLIHVRLLHQRSLASLFMSLICSVIV